MFSVKLVTPSSPIRSFECEQINLETANGDMGLLSHHMPLVSAMRIGIMTAIKGGERERYAVAGGVVFFQDNVATIVSDAIEYEGDIDLARAEHAKHKAEQRLQSKDPNIDVKRAELALMRALNRIRVSNDG